MGDYEYRVMHRSRSHYGEESFAVTERGYAPGWTEWTEWEQYTNRTGRELPYATIAPARAASRSMKRYSSSDPSRTQVTRETETRIERRPVRNDWEVTEES